MTVNDPQEGAADRLPYRRSDGGDRKELECRQNFASLLRASALVKMARRKSKTLDESDFGAAYDDLLANSKPDWICQIFGAVLFTFGGVGVTWGLTLLSSSTDPNPHDKPGWWLLLCGITVGVAGAFVQFWPLRK